MKQQPDYQTRWILALGKLRQAAEHGTAEQYHRRQRRYLVACRQLEACKASGETLPHDDIATLEFEARILAKS